MHVGSEARAKGVACESATWRNTGHNDNCGRVEMKPRVTLAIFLPRDVPWLSPSRIHAPWLPVFRPLPAGESVNRQRPPRDLHRKSTGLRADTIRRTGGILGRLQSQSRNIFIEILSSRGLSFFFWFWFCLFFFLRRENVPVVIKKIEGSILEFQEKEEPFGF